MHFSEVDENHEVTANFVSERLFNTVDKDGNQNTALIREIAENKTWYSRVLDWIKEKITALFNHRTKADFLKMQRMFENAYRAANKNSAADSGVSYSIRAGVEYDIDNALNEKKYTKSQSDTDSQYNSMKNSKKVAENGVENSAEGESGRQSSIPSGPIAEMLEKYKSGYINDEQVYRQLTAPATADVKSLHPEVYAEQLLKEYNSTADKDKITGLLQLVEQAVERGNPGTDSGFTTARQIVAEIVSHSKYCYI